MPIIPQSSLFDGKTCNRCKQWKPFSEFYKKSGRQDQWLFQCKGCFMTTCAENVKIESPERRAKRLAGLLRVQKRLGGAWLRKKLETDPDYQKRLSGAWLRKKLETDPDYKKRVILKSRRKHAVRVNVTNANRRALQKKAEGFFTVDDWESIKRHQGYQCLCCLKVEPVIRLTIDHVIPLKHGGPNWPSNLQGLCKPCNSRKSTKHTDYRV